jgi:hypothetical protein
MFMVDPRGQVILEESDKYVRFEVVGEKSVLYTNPIYRLKTSDVAEFSNIPYKIDILKTFVYRILVLAMGLFLLILLFKRMFISAILSNVIGVLIEFFMKNLWKNVL